jgi:hypothetical protein
VWCSENAHRGAREQRMAAPLENHCHYQDEGELFVEIITADET